MRAIVLTAAVTFTSLITIPASFANRIWNDANNPAIMDAGYHYNFDKLPLSGGMDLTKRGWSDTYWPLDEGMIVKRWQVPDDHFKKDKAPDVNNIRYMSLEDINLLSPAEKYDLARGDYSFTLSNKLRKDNSPHSQDWRGICNGWTQASLNFDEPKPTIFTNRDGIKIPFGASDIKGLLAYYYAKIDASDTVMVGKRCMMRAAGAWLSDACGNDINAGAFHVIMANEMGLKHKGFAADRDPLNEIWNQPFVKFEAHVVSELNIYKGDKLSHHASKDAVREITMNAEVYYADDDPVVPSVDPYIGTDKNKITKTTYNYILEVNAYGNIIGGEWLDSNRPDFVWKQQFNKPQGEFHIIETIYEQSQRPVVQ